MKRTRNFHFFYGKIETEIESGLLQQTINTLNKLFITFLRSFEQKNLLLKVYATFNIREYFLFWP